MSDEPDHVADAPVMPAGDSAGAAEPSVGRRRTPPRNYLERGERRRLLWRFMPAALAVLAGAVGTLVHRRLRPAPDVLAHTAVDFILGAMALGHVYSVSFDTGRPLP